MEKVLLEYKAFQSLLKLKQIAYNHNCSVDRIKAILKRNVPFSYHLCIDDMLKHNYVDA